jgi:small redox-active disulfide protein 2
MMKLEIFGTGCTKCKRLSKNVEKAVKELGADAQIFKIEDVNEIVSRGVMMTPGLAVDGEIKVLGRVPSVDEIKNILSG